MATPLESYLVDHLAGADAALDLIDELAGEHDGDLARFFRELHIEIRHDRDELERLLHHFGWERSTLRSAGAKLVGKAAQLRLVGADARGAAFRRLEALDMLQGGIEGKRALWRAMQAAAERDRSLAVLDYAALEARAASQRDRVDQVRLDAAREALPAAGGG